MPTVSFSHRDLISLLGRYLSKDSLSGFLSAIKCEVESFEGDNVIVEVSSDRPDLLSVEGIARALRGFLGIRPGLERYKLKNATASVRVTTSLKGIRPYIACGLVCGLRLTDEAIRQLVQLQEKLHLTHCRRRRKASIGIHDFDKVKPPFTYSAEPPSKIRFTPLGEIREMRGDEVLDTTEKGREYGHLIRGYNRYPLLSDSEGRVMAMPPIINGTITQVTESTRNIFIDVTGTDQSLCSSILNIVATSLYQRAERLEHVIVTYGRRSLVTPHLEPLSKVVPVAQASKMIGIDLKPRQVAGLLGRMGYGILKVGRDRVNVAVPAYRTDILHPVDLVEDIAIAYGYNNLEPLLPYTATIGRELERTKFTRLVRDLMVGLGFQEVYTYIMTNRDILFGKMGMADEEVVEVQTPLSLEYSALRSWLLPGLLDFLSYNRHVPYPQNIFECGDTLTVNTERPTKTDTRRKVAAVICDDKAGYEDIQGTVYSLLNNLGIDSWTVGRVEHPSFIHGRVAKITARGTTLGFMGEIEPSVLVNFGLENPTAGMEIDLESLMSPRRI